MAKKKRGLTMDQILEWEAYDRMDPIGNWREDFRMAYLATVITNLAIKLHTKSGKLTTLTDFLPVWDQGDKSSKSTQTADQMKNILMGIANSVNKKIESKERKKSNTQK